MDRRALLTAALGAVVTACTPRARPAPRPSATPSPTPTVDPDVAILSAWWMSERRLAGALPAVAALRAAHEARAEAVAEHLAARAAPLPAEPARPTRPASQEEAAAYTRYVSSLASVASPEVAVLGAELAAGARQGATVLALAARR